MGLMCQIFTPAHGGDSSNGGISSWATHVTLINVEGPFEPTEDRPAVCLVRRTFGKKEYLHVEPVDISTGQKQIGPMFGGAFIYSSDSRFGKISQYPIALHDRFETPEEYRYFSD